MERIKALTRPNAANRFMILHEQYIRIIKNNGRDNKPENEKRTDLLKDIDKLFDICGKDSVEEMRDQQAAHKGGKRRGYRYLPGAHVRVMTRFLRKLVCK